MKKHILLFAISLTFLASTLSAQDKPDPNAPNSERHEFVIANFHTESGVTLPQARIVYGTYGHLNTAKDNVVLLPSHYMADLHGYEWLIGPDKALDPSKLFLVATELFGNGRSSSPSNTPEPLHGPRFPITTIRDNVEAVHRLLTEDLHVTHLRAVIGFSMGAEQAFQWAISYPTFADRIVATSGTAKCYPHGFVRLEGQIAALTADGAFKNGDYTTPPIKGLQAFGIVWTGWLFSQEWWRQELWRADAKPGTTFQQVVDNFRTDFIPGADANDLILQMRTWEKHDVGTTSGFNGDVERALASIKIPVLYMPSATDLYFPITDARYEASFIPGVTLLPIPSLWGHPAGAAPNAADSKFLNENISRFMAGQPIQSEATRSTAVDLAANSPAAKPEDVASIDSTIRALYDVISGPAGPRNWDRFRSLFAPNARLTAATKNPDGTVRVRLFSAEDYVKGAGSYFSTHGFFESPIATKVERFGNMAQALSSYASRNAPTEAPIARGINNIQLLNDGKRWWVVSILWDEERPNNPLPKEFAAPDHQ
ncbi:MAG TPA: alpha/beta fold hydrolase [Candidatus Acidoferrum sp.]|jgi:homoserine O-acetyltransferase